MRWTRRAATLAVTSASLALAFDASAQRGDTLQVGVRYRITLPDFPDRPDPQLAPSRWLTGTFVGRRGDSVLVQPHPTTGVVAVPLASIDRLERSRGISRLGGALENGIAGAAFGALFAAVFYDRYVHSNGFETRGRAAGTVAAYVGGSAFIASALFPTERWRRIAKPTP